MADSFSGCCFKTCTTWSRFGAERNYLRTPYFCLGFGGFCSLLALVMGKSKSRSRSGWRCSFNCNLFLSSSSFGKGEPGGGRTQRAPVFKLPANTMIGA